MVGISPIGVFLFYKVLSLTPWTFGKIIEVSTLLLRVSIRCQCVQRFWRCSEVVCGTVYASARTALRVFFHYWGSPLSWSGCAYSSNRAVLAALLGGECFFLSERGSFKSLILGWFCSCKAMFRDFTPYLLILSSIDDKSLIRWSSTISKAIYYMFRLSYFLV